MTWNDRLDYKTDKIESSTSMCGLFRIVIHRHIDHGRNWVLSVFAGSGIVVNCMDLKAKKISDARQEAGKFFRELLGAAMIDLEG